MVSDACVILLHARRVPKGGVAAFGNTGIRSAQRTVALRTLVRSESGIFAENAVSRMISLHEYRLLVWNMDKGRRKSSRPAPYEAGPSSEPDVRLSRIRLLARLITNADI